MRKLAFIAALLILCISGAAFAQDATPEATPAFNFCGTLSSADCAILQKAQTSMRALDSVSYDLTFDATISGASGMPEPMKFSLTGNGSYSGASQIRSNMALAQTDPGQYLTDALDNLNADITLTLSLPPEVTAEEPDVPSNITFQARLVDGIGYVNTDTLKALMGSSAASIKGWYGIDLANLLKSAMQQMPNMFSEMNAMNSMSSMSSMSSMNPATIKQYQEILTNTDLLNRFLKIERTDDGSSSTATFQYTLNFGVLMSDPNIQQLMRQQIETQAQSEGSTMTQQQTDQAMAAASQMLKGITMVIKEGIGVDDGNIHSVSGTITFDTKGMMAVFGPTSGSTSSQEAPTIDMDFALNYSNFNSAPTITAPPNPVVIPYQSILEGMTSEMNMESGSSSGSNFGSATEVPFEPMTTPASTSSS